MTQRNERPLPRTTHASDTVVPFPSGRLANQAAPPVLGRGERILLSRLRWWLTLSRLAARTSVEEACFVLRSGGEATINGYAIALFRLLDAHARRRLVFYGPNARTCSSDELWLVQLLLTMMAGDEIRVGALIGWRIAPNAQRRALFLLEGLARLLRETGLQED